MPLLADRVKETTTTTGTGTLALGGAPTGFRTFAAAFGTAASVYYVIAGPAEWEVGIGTTGTGTLTRDTVLVSSAGGTTKVSFSAGTKDVFCSYVADRAVTTSDAATLTNKTIDDYTNNVGANATHFRIKANENLTKGDVVKADGFTPGEAAIQVVKTAAASDVALGIVEQTLTTGSFGTAVTIGELFDVNTNGLTVGATIYSNGSGGYTTTKPSSGLYQPLGWIVRANTNNGVIAVNVVAPLYVEASTNTANTLVLRDGSGNFSAGTITATGGLAVGSDTTGNVSVGAAWTFNPFRTTAPQYFQYRSTGAAFTVASDAGINISLIRCVTGAGGPVLVLNKSQGTYAAPTAVANGNVLGSIVFQAYGGTAVRQLARIDGTVETYTSDTDISSYLTFSTSAAGGAAATERWRINGAGHLLAGADASYDIGASGATRPRNIYTSGDITVAGVRVGLGNSALSTNTAVGVSALNAITTGDANVGIGYQALQNTTTGTVNTAVGYSAAAATTTGASNTAIGRGALQANTTGDNNTAVGALAGYSTSTASNNVSVGASAMYAVTTGGNNSAVGKDALRNITTGTESVAVGFTAAVTLTTGNYQTALGAYALQANSTSHNNTGVGYAALYYTTGAGNIALGYNAGGNITTGAKNTIVGSYDGNQDSIDLRTASNNIVLSDGDGNARLYYNGASNFWAFRNGGTERVRVNSSGQLLIGTTSAGISGNSATALTVANGTTTVYQSLRASDGTELFALASNGSTAIRSFSNSHFSIGTNNTNRWQVSAAGHLLAEADATYDIGASGATRPRNVFISGAITGGSDATFNSISVGRGGGSVAGNVAVGLTALTSNTSGANNTAVGWNAVRTNSTGNNNTGVGFISLFSTTTGSSNTAIGHQSGYNITSGGTNTALGANALYTATTANDNTAVGSGALQVGTGSNNTIIGGNAGGLITTGSSNTIVGRYNGNADGLDIRTSSNYAVIADGDGNRLLSMYNGGTLALDGGAVPQSGTGITFPATQSASSDANTLDDYEEGTWTPADASGASLTFTSVTATYTKIGNMVTVQTKLTYPTTADTSQAKISGLPFAPGSHANITYCNPGTATGLGAGQGWVDAASTTMTLITQQNATRTNANLSTLTIYFSGTYMV